MWSCSQDFWPSWYSQTNIRSVCNTFYGSETSTLPMIKRNPMDDATSLRQKYPVMVAHRPSVCSHKVISKNGSVLHI